MKMVKFILIASLVLLTALTVNAEKKGEKTVVYNVNLHCVSCKEKVEKNIPYEKGVKELKVDMETQTVAVTFKEDKNTTEGIQKAIENLKLEVKGVQGQSCPQAANCAAKECPKSKDCPKAKDCPKMKDGKCPGAENCTCPKAGKCGDKNDACPKKK